MPRDVVIVGAGPAGLTAALVLGRCRRDVVVLDSGAYRNADSRAVHCFPSREGISPAELREVVRAELAAYTTVELLTATATDARRDDDGWEVMVEGGEAIHARALLLATGLVDTLPDIPGARELHGRRVFPCPYCDGWELRDRPLVALAPGDDAGARVALGLRQWTADVVLCTSGPATITPPLAARLARAGIAVDERPIAALTEHDDALVVRFADGATLRRAALFYHLGATPRCDLATRLGAIVDHRGSVDVDRHEQTTVDGLWVAGDATRDALLAIVAAGEGAAAAMSINTWLGARDR